MTLGLFLLIVILTLLFAALPKWPYSQEWGYRPSGAFTLLLVVLIVLMTTNRI